MILRFTGCVSITEWLNELIQIGSRIGLPITDPQLIGPDALGHVIESAQQLIPERREQTEVDVSLSCTLAMVKPMKFGDDKPVLE